MKGHKFYVLGSRACKHTWNIEVVFCHLINRNISLRLAGTFSVIKVMLADVASKHVHNLIYLFLKADFLTIELKIFPQSSVRSMNLIIHFLHICYCTAIFYYFNSSLFFLVFTPFSVFIHGNHTPYQSLIYPAQHTLFFALDKILFLFPSWLS